MKLDDEVKEEVDVQVFPNAQVAPLTWATGQATNSPFTASHILTGLGWALGGGHPIGMAAGVINVLLPLLQGVAGPTVPESCAESKVIRTSSFRTPDGTPLYQSELNGQKRAWRPPHDDDSDTFGVASGGKEVPAGTQIVRGLTFVLTVEATSLSTLQSYVQGKATAKVVTNNNNLADYSTYRVFW